MFNKLIQSIKILLTPLEWQKNGIVSYTMFRDLLNSLGVVMHASQEVFLEERKFNPYTLGLVLARI